jgi:hypothetical protein
LLDKDDQGGSPSEHHSFEDVSTTIRNFYKSSWLSNKPDPTNGSIYFYHAQASSDKELGHIQSCIQEYMQAHGVSGSISDYYNSPTSYGQRQFIFTTRNDEARAAMNYCQG